MMRLLYTIGIRLYIMGIHLAALFLPKAKAWVEGRKQFWQHHSPRQDDGFTWVWVHCASLGEFEQGRPVIEAIKKDYPEARILLSFFSPSGFNIRKNFPLADKVVYLPADLPSNARWFLDTFRPHLAIFVKYEFWHNYLRALGKQGIPYFFISAVFRPSQPFFRPWGRWFMKQLNQASHLFVQDQPSLNLLEKHGIHQVSVSGDTRYDRVKKNAEMAGDVPGVLDFVKGSRVIVAGSTWPPDEAILYELMKQGIPHLRLIVAPHEVGDKRVNAICQALGPSVVRYSRLCYDNARSSRVLVIDNIGLLSSLYAYADISYVGGAFGSGLHNILEPAAHGKPVFFGPYHHKFPEAAALVAAGGGYSVLNSRELINKVSELLRDEPGIQSAALASKRFVASQQGATVHIMNYIGSIIQNLHHTPNTN